MKFRSIQMRMLVMILPLVILTMAAMSYFSYMNSKNIINAEIENKMNFSINQTTESMKRILVEHSRIPELLARTVEATGTQLSKQQYIEIFKKVISANSNTLGAGIWYEPYAYSKDQKYFGPYVYKDGSNMVSTLDYEDPKYDYPNQSWYTIAKDAKTPVVWTDPYYDGTTKITMITCTAPFKDSTGKMLGVATGDVDLKSLQQLVFNLKVGNTGRAFLLGKDGMFLSDKDPKRSMKVKITDDTNKSLAELGKTMLQDATPGTLSKGSFKDTDGVMHTYYTRLADTGWILALSIPESELYSGLNALLIQSLILILIAIFVISIVVSLSSRNIKDRISKVNQFSKELSKGDFTHTIATEDIDEVGQMTENLNAMITDTRHIIQGVSTNIVQLVSTSSGLAESADQTQKANEQIADTMQSLAHQKTDEQSHILKAYEYSNEIANAMKQISDSIQIVFGSVRNTSQVSVSGNQVVSDSIIQMKKINSDVQAASDVVNTLGEKSKTIDEIVAVITSISEQTNLLALNAAIEAARAGEHGRGFAVVADEVRKLAEQSGKAADNISGLIKEIQNEIQKAVRSMETGNQTTQQGISMIESAGNSFKTISESVSGISSGMQDVSKTVESLYNNTTVLSDSMDTLTHLSTKSLEGIESIAAAVEEQAALAREVSDVATNLSEMSSELGDDIRHFKI